MIILKPFLFALLFISCTNGKVESISSQKTETNSVPIEIKLHNALNSIRLKNRLDSSKVPVQSFIDSAHYNSTISKSWDQLAYSIGGCLVGGQYCKKAKCGGEGCCFNIDQRWIAFFKLDKKELTTFLVKQLPDTNKTKVHTCPFFAATEGELAVYALQKIHKINWYDLDEKYAKYVNGTLVSGNDFYSLQDVLQKELANTKSLKLLTQKWMEKL